MSIPKPYSGPSAVRLTAVINEDNDTDLRLGVDFLFGPPSDYTSDPERNTKVLLIPAPGSIYDESEEVHYERLPLTVLDSLPAGFTITVVMPNLPTSIHQILGNINNALGLDLTPDEVVDIPITEVANQYPLRIIEAVSLAWIDSNYQFKARPLGSDEPLGDKIRVRSFMGLNYEEDT